MVVIGRRLFDLANGWNGKPAAGEHVYGVTHEQLTDWNHADTAPFTFVDGVETAIPRRTRTCRRLGRPRQPRQSPRLRHRDGLTGLNACSRPAAAWAGSLT